MKPEEIMLLQWQIQILVGIVADMPLREYVAAMDHCDTIGPIFDPTLYRAKSKTMDEEREIVESLIPFQDAILKARKKLESRSTTPYPGYPVNPCPNCGGSTAEPWRRYPACKVCNPCPSR